MLQVLAEVELRCFAGKDLWKVSSGVKSRIGEDLVIYVTRIGEVNFNT